MRPSSVSFIVCPLRENSLRPVNSSRLPIRRESAEGLSPISLAAARAELEDVAVKIGDPRIAEVEEAVDTLGGLAFVLAEQVPSVGSVLRHPSGWCMEVTGADETHVTRLRLHRPDTELAEEAEA